MEIGGTQEIWNCSQCVQIHYYIIQEKHGIWEEQISFYNRSKKGLNSIWVLDSTVFKSCKHHSFLGFSVLMSSDQIRDLYLEQTFDICLKKWSSGLSLSSGYSKGHRE